MQILSTELKFCRADVPQGLQIVVVVDVTIATYSLPDLNFPK